MAKETIEVQPTNATTGEEVQMETRTTIEQVETPVESKHDDFEIKGAVMVVNKRPGKAALFGAAAGGAAIGAGTFFVSTLASKKLTKELLGYLEAYISEDEQKLELLRKKNPGLAHIDTMTLYDFMKEMNDVMDKARIGWKNPFGATKKQIDQLRAMMILAFKAKEKSMNDNEPKNSETINKAVEEINDGDEA